MAKRKRHGRGDDHGEGGHDERWLVSYSDFITLMFVVFLVLFSMARVDNAKYAGLARSLRSTMGPGPAVPTLPQRPELGPAEPLVETQRPPAIGPGSPDWSSQVVNQQPPTAEPPVQTTTPKPPAASTAPNPAPPKETSPQPQDAMGSLKGAFSSLPGVKSGLMSVALEERGLVISIVGSVLFDPGATELRPEARALLSEVAGQLHGVEFPIMVQGTADESPAGTQGLSPWDLAALRAGSVVRYLVDQKGFPGSQFITIGYGSSGSGDATSRMVTLVVLRKAGQ